MANFILEKGTETLSLCIAPAFLILIMKSPIGSVTMMIF
mgnify:CR=1 FL=1